MQPRPWPVWRSSQNLVIATNGQTIGQEDLEEKAYSVQPMIMMYHEEYRAKVPHEYQRYLCVSSFVDDVQHPWMFIVVESPPSPPYSRAYMSHQSIHVLGCALAVASHAVGPPVVVILTLS